MTLLWSEKYQQFEEMRAFALAKELSRRAYYRARPLLPRRAQLLLRRGFSRVQGRARFPRWPTEPALHDLYGLLFRLLEQVAGEVVPYIAPWPGGHSWALILTHDVEKAMGYERTPSLARLESERGYRSAFFFVPMRDYTVDDDLVTKLDEEGFEVGVHGLFHDGKDVESLVTLQQRLPLVRQAAERWRAKGFRSPGTLRRWDLVPVLGFDYDSSYSDTAPYEPQPGGSCSWLPYFNSDVVELPITLVQDHTIFELLGRDDESLWLDKATFLRERGGMALLLAHPDYLAPGPRLDAYVRFLDHFLDDTSAWKALPRDVSTWWRSRAASSLRREGGTWKIDGPAASEGVVVLADPVDRPEIEAAAMTRGAW
jgi:peptidoglycan/xylan/chitin deacetylase (PgdA/CDA1 family)